MSKNIKEKECIRLNNGNLIMFLHHRLPFLQAETKRAKESISNKKGQYK